MTTETLSTCPRCRKPVAPRTVAVQTELGVVHVHCATREERGTETTVAPRRVSTRHEPRRPSSQNWLRPDGELSYDC